ncbi:hypothetical protein E4631_10900 [Hymenobacter sp. UV11]|uniref:tellurite resistance TerB C-terminal domain-containing protein n=1 Tax=Hymenobacter sp. UV11 TaxID=1849735 RepID=UPI00105F9F4E|nr:tellurite resistance TerB C-terminal domain-containing protein [Hymenobacter sp. UV11]TDN40473.1 hypothetical protein A8B98_13655 [Hymenobacter sp. UV11]TFZ66517.1 hypothetical protein E4631_10900 [Hymenobacter sp. UV11]
MPDSADDSIIDVTGLFFKLKRAIEREIVSLPSTRPTTPPASTYTYYDYEPPSLGKIYREKLGLTPRQVSWVNRFPLPTNSFLDTMEAGREATVRLYLALLPLLEQQLKAEGSTLAQTVKTLDSRAKSLRYYANTSWYTPAAPKTGADTYLAIFRLCENAVRERFGHKRKMSSVFGGALAELAPVFRELLGRRVEELLPPLLALVPAPDHKTELLLNEQNTGRWKAELEQLTTTGPALEKALAALAARNARNPALGALYQEATRRLAPTNREEALRYHLRYLHQLQARFAEAKPLPKALHKQLFALPEQAARFQGLVNELAFYKNLDGTLAKVPTVYVQPRKKIELNRSAIHAVRDQHAGTVALLNEYLQDAPAPTPPPTAKPAKATRRPQAARPAKALNPAAPAAYPFAPGLGLTAPQQALLQLFGERALALPQAEIEALAKAHGVLRNQLIDGLNEVCYALLDDVLIEESDDDYTIYEAYYQKISQ